MQRKKTIDGMIKLTRYREYVAFVTVTTLLGVLCTGMHLSVWDIPRIIIVLAANLLSVGFSFMINDVEDAPDDALNPDKVKRNPISAQLMTRRSGYFASIGVAIFSFFLFFFLGTLPFIVGAFSLLLGLTYSWRMIRLKGIPALDLLSHGLMLAGLQFMTGYFTVYPHLSLSRSFLLPFFMLFTFSMYGELFNEMRDFKYDRLAKLSHTASFIGRAKTLLLMKGLLLIASLTITLSVIGGILPIWWILLIACICGFLLMLQRKFTASNILRLPTSEMQGTIINSTTIALVSWIFLRIIG